MSDKKQKAMIPKQYNLLSKEFEFLHEIKPDYHVWLMAEVDYMVGRNLKEDGCEVIGEITDAEANVYEIKPSIIRKEFQSKFETEIEEIRKEVLNNL